MMPLVMHKGPCGDIYRDKTFFPPQTSNLGHGFRKGKSRAEQFCVHGIGEGKSRAEQV